MVGGTVSGVPGSRGGVRTEEDGSNVDRVTLEQVGEGFCDLDGAVLDGAVAVVVCGGTYS